jgi:hypothetical protein
VHSILIVRRSFSITKEAILSSDSETGWKEIANVGIVMHWLSFGEQSEKV